MATRPNSSSSQLPGAVRSPEEVVRAVIDCVCRSSVGDTAALVDLGALYADPTYVLHPMRPELPAIRTRDHFRRHSAAVSRQATSAADARRPVDLMVHATLDPEVVITEFKYETIVGGQTLYTPCIWVTRVRDGRIVEARDYNGQPDTHRGGGEYPAG
jgi:ketosteroid isomerase-like protein